MKTLKNLTNLAMIPILAGAVLGAIYIGGTSAIKERDEILERAYEKRSNLKNKLLEKKASSGDTWKEIYEKIDETEKYNSLSKCRDEYSYPLTELSNGDMKEYISEKNKKFNEYNIKLNKLEEQIERMENDLKVTN